VCGRGVCGECVRFGCGMCVFVCSRSGVCSMGFVSVWCGCVCVCGVFGVSVVCECVLWECLVWSGRGGCVCLVECLVWYVCGV